MSSASRVTRAVPASPAATCDYVHLLENENGYGIAKPLHKDGFQKEHYHTKLHHGGETHGMAPQNYKYNTKL